VAAGDASCAPRSACLVGEMSARGRGLGAVSAARHRGCVCPLYPQSRPRVAPIREKYYMHPNPQNKVRYTTARHQARLHRSTAAWASSASSRRAAPLLLQGGRLLRLMPARRQASARPRLQQPLTVTILLLWLHLLLLHYGWTDAPGAAPVELDPDAPASRALARAGALLGATEAVGGGPAAAVAAGAGGGTRGCCGSASGGGSCGGFVRSLIPRPSPTHLCAPHTH